MDKCTITEANASLIAAAPDLYTALQQLVDYITPADSNDYQTAIGRAKAALARASGEVTP